jgi:hypothetical protein
MFGICGLCLNEADLQHSHIVSNFFDRRLRLDSGTPFMRGTDPNRRVQSGPKRYLLCRSCEGVFSAAEDEFAQTVYHPTLDGGRFEIVWTRGLARFVASLTWRNIIITMRDHPGPVEGIWSPADWAALVSAELQLRQYLLGQAVYPRDIEHHVFVTDASAQTEHDGVNTVLNMAITMGMPATEHSVYSMITVPGMVFFALLNPTDACREMWRKGTLVVPGGTFRNHSQVIEDGHAGYYIVQSGELFSGKQAEISEKQRAVLRDAAANYRASGSRPTERIARAAIQDRRNREVRNRTGDAGDEQ